MHFFFSSLKVLQACINSRKQQRSHFKCNARLQMSKYLCLRQKNHRFYASLLVTGDKPKQAVQHLGIVAWFISQTPTKREKKQKWPEAHWRCSRWHQMQKLDTYVGEVLNQIGCLRPGHFEVIITPLFFYFFEKFLRFLAEEFTFRLLLLTLERLFFHSGSNRRTAAFARKSPLS